MNISCPGLHSAPLSPPCAPGGPPAAPEHNKGERRQAVPPRRTPLHPRHPQPGSEPPQTPTLGIPRQTPTPKTPLILRRTPPDPTDPTDPTTRPRAPPPGPTPPHGGDTPSSSGGLLSNPPIPYRDPPAP